ncbi:MAG: hypothetical protein HUJ89_01975 [Bacteroidales bacterium]|nr:hypothetical protein [Bacteroidales bacterium]
MKHISILVLAAMGMLLSANSSAQGKYGPDSVQCVMYLNYYQPVAKSGNLEQAAPSWRKAFSVCPPTASQNMLLDGMKIMRMEIKKNANNPTRAKQLADTLLLLHEVRVKTYPKNATADLQTKASDMMNNSAFYDANKVYSVLGEAMEYYQKESDRIVALDAAAAAAAAKKFQPQPAIPIHYFKTAVEFFNNGTFNADQVLESYGKASDVMASMIAACKDEKMDDAKRDLDNLFATSGVASCENIVAIYTPKYNADPSDKNTLAKIVSLMSSANCVDDALFRNAVEGLHKVEPSYNSAYLLYKLYSNTPNSDAAIKYMLEAIAYPESDTEKDAEFEYELATYCYKKLGNDALAVSHAKKCIEMSDTYDGKAYFLIGTIWGSQKNEGNEVESRAHFWVATDYMQKAKKADPSLESEANQYIASFKKYYPVKSDAFMYDLVDGQSYSVSRGALRDNTTVRTQE